MSSAGTAIGGYAWVLPVLFTVVWCLSWPSTPGKRWIRLALCGAVSVLVVVIGFVVPLPPPRQPPVCSGLFACDLAFAGFWIGVGISGFVGFVALLLANGAVDLFRMVLRAR